MAVLSPRVAAEIAAQVYAVQDENGIAFKIFTKRPEFSKKKNAALPLKATVGSRLINTDDGFGVCALGGDGYEKDIFLIFRGSTTANYMADWVNNARLGIECSATGLPVHIGFNHIFSSMRTHIQEFLLANPEANGTIHCIGHSLGGAIATLVADWVSSNRANTVKLYTFGAPKAGLEFFAKKLTTRITENNIFRVYHSTDPVPMVPLYPFTHAPIPGWGYHIVSSDALLGAKAHGMDKYIESVTGASWPSLMGPPPDSAQEKVIARWLKSERTVNPFSPKFWELVNAGLALVLKKIMQAGMVLVQSAFMGAITLADKIAFILHKGIDLSKELGSWVLQLMHKIMKALGMRIVKTAKELTQALLRSILVRLMNRMAEEAQRAIRQIFRS